MDHTEEVAVNRVVPCTCDEVEDDASNRTETFDYRFEAEADIMLVIQHDVRAPTPNSASTSALELNIDLPGECLDNEHDSDPDFDDIYCAQCDEINEPKTVVDVTRRIESMRLACSQCAKTQTVTADAAAAIKALVTNELRSDSYLYDPSSLGCW